MAPMPFCDWCGEVIRPQDEERRLPHAGTPGKRWSYYHQECLIRSIAGSVAHQKRECSCYGGTGEDDPALTTRQAAKAAYDYLLSHAAH